MYRTDKQFMKNPATASSRIYIGNLAETVVPDDVEAKFSCHGKILGLVLQRGFGFIQFENDSQAQSAISNEHGSMFHGRKINVKQAIDNTKGKNNAQQNQANPPKQNVNNFHNNNQTNFQPNQSSNNFQNQNFQNNQNNFPNNQNNFQGNNQGNFQNQQSNFHNQSQGNFQNNPGNYHNQGNFNNQGNFLSAQGNFPNNQNNFQNGPRNIPPLIPVKEEVKPQIENAKPIQQSPLPGSQPMDQQPPNPPNIQAQSQNMQDTASIKSEELNIPKEKRKRKPRPPKREFREDFREDVPPFYDPVYNTPYRGPVMDRPERNDCEIIVVAKGLTEYAEYIEQRLKTLGLIVDLLFPNEDVPIGRVLANISSRGCLYAILIMPRNEEHRSLTLNILHGVPEEHRNMPIEDALLLITKNFETYMRGESFGSNSGNDKMTLTSRHPEHIQVLLNLLAENRQVTTGQYDKLINYLQEKRELQSQFELAEGIDSFKESDVKNKQAELQNRIMNILNKKVDDLSKITPEKTETAKTPTPLLNDPSVQKALDSLLSGDMFKGLAS